MKKLFLVFLLCWSGAFASTVEREQTVQYDSEYYHQDTALVIDSADNMYIGTRIVENNLHVRKVSPAGVIMWEKTLDIQGFDSKNFLALDANDNLLVTGHKRDDSDEDVHISERAKQIVLAKYAPNGNQIWKKAYGTGQSAANAVTVAPDGTLIVAGVTSSDMDGYTNSGREDIFVIKFNATGEKIWSYLYGSSSYDVPTDMTTDADGNIFVVGETGGGIDGYILQNEDWSDSFVTKFSSSGEKLWTRQFGSGYMDSVKSDIVGDVYVAGRTSKTFDGQETKGKVFVIKFNTSGTRLWIKQTGNPDKYAKGARIAIDSDGKIFVAGATYGSMGEYSSVGGRNPDTYLLRFLADGTLAETYMYGTESHDVGQSVVVDSHNNVFIAGWTTGDLDGNAHGDKHSIFLTKFKSTYQKYTLTAGWNLIGLNTIISLSEIQSQVGADNLLVIQGQAKTYKKEYEDGGLGFLNDFSGFEENKGYWVKVLHDSALGYGIGK